MFDFLSGRESLTIYNKNKVDRLNNDTIAMLQIESCSNESIPQKKSFAALKFLELIIKCPLS